MYGYRANYYDNMSQAGMLYFNSHLFRKISRPQHNLTSIFSKFYNDYNALFEILIRLINIID